MTFEDITIIGVDEKSSSRIDSQSALFNIVLNLSASAPWEWANYFNELWRHEFYMMKRNAEASGSRITITCVPDELESDHLPHLLRVIAQVNSAYRSHVAKSQAHEEARKLREREDAALLQNI